MDPSMRLAGMTAIITGANGGIGAAITTLFAQNGARLCLVDRVPASTGAASEISDSGQTNPDVVRMVGDVTDPSFVSRVVEQGLSRWGKIDLLVNSVGVARSESVAMMSKERWDEVINDNLTSIYVTCHAVVPHMISAGFGRMINVSSQLAIRGAAEMAHYSAAKAGVIAFSKSLARETSRYGVTVNCIAPGPIDTPMLEASRDQWDESALKNLPLGRVGQPEEVAPSVLFLAAQPDGNLFTGQVLSPNCGDVMV